MKRPITLICGSLLAMMSLQAQNQNAWGKVSNQPNRIAKAADNEEMIVKQPAGKLYKNLYCYAEGFYSMWGLIFDGKKDGTARDMVIADDGTFYIQNPILGLKVIKLLEIQLPLNFHNLSSSTIST